MKIVSENIHWLLIQGYNLALKYRTEKNIIKVSIDISFTFLHY